MTQQQEYQIIELVIIIFQNVGIKRYIDKIDILKNYQIYFEICKIIFPQSMIQLLRFSQGPKTNAEKIQGVIDIVGKILQNDLYHISGEAISEGKLSHIRNFLHILQLLSQNVHKGNRDEEQVESAPQNTRSMSDYERQGHNTVIGIDKEFEREYDEEQDNSKTDEERDTTRQYHQRNGNKKESQQQHTENEDSQSERPMIPIMNKKSRSQRKNFIKTKTKPHKPIEKINIHVVKPKPFKKTGKTIVYKQTLDIPKLQEFIKEREIEQPIRKRFKSNFVRKINNIIEDFQAKKLTDLKLEHNIWVKKNQIKTAEKQNQIEEQNKERMLFTNELIGERKKKINTLKNAKQAVNIMSNLFKQQRNILRGMRKAKEESELQQIEAIVQNNEHDEYLLRKALNSANPENFRPINNWKKQR